MAASTQISLTEYLHTSYRPDREYIDGEVLERNLGKWEHARIQALLVMWFGANEKVWGVQVATEWRTRVSETRVRIPDVVLVNTDPQPDILEAPPVLIIEILSPDDSYVDTQRRANDYRKMGAQTLWIIDPETRTGRVCSQNLWEERRRLEVPGTDIYADLDELFSNLAPSTHT